MSVGLYIHFPWCIQKCPYCDFNSHALKGHLPQDDYIDRLIKECHEVEQIYGSTPQVSSIFLGGGTPSLFDARSIGRLLDYIAQHWHITADCEITIEANPGSSPDFSSYRSIGINRLSLGVQSFNDASLIKIGRIHDSATALECYHKATAAGFERINLDIMFALPDQSLEQAMKDLQTTIDCQPEHISWYQLTLEPNTYFYHHPPNCPPDDDSEKIYFTGKDLLRKNGYMAYEVSAYTRDKKCLHNVNYWSFGDYIGIGAGAHSKWRGSSLMRRQTIKSPKHYLLSQSATAQITHITPQEALCEYFLNRSRMPGTVEIADISSRTGLDIKTIRQFCQLPQLRDYLSIENQRISFKKHALNFNQTFMTHIYQLVET